MRKITMKKLAIFSSIIFLVFILIFRMLCALAKNGTIQNIELSDPLSAVFSLLMALPMIVALYAFGKHLQAQGKYRLAHSLLFVSIGLFFFGLIVIIFWVLFYIYNKLSFF